ncbi:MAG: radical SAM protein [Candidatus Roizmanbacteria bacterium]|nr:radical SAM protein [Candidatus Roizmanbacteria bacterium]
MKTKNATLVYISTIEKEIHPAIYGIKAYALKYIQDKNIQILTKSIRAKHSTQSSRYALYPSFSPQEVQKIGMSIVRQHPIYVGFSTYVWNVEATLLLAQYIKNLDPNITIILGGAEATYNAKKILSKEKCVDVVVLDEGELPFLDLIEGKKPIQTIQGIMYKNKGKIIHNPHRNILDLTTVPSSYLVGLIDLKKEKKSAFIIETSRGCPFKCAYCSYNINNYAKLRLFPVERVEKELAYLLRNKVNAIHVVDDNFNIYDLRAQRILKMFIKDNNNTHLELFIRADAWQISEQLGNLLANPYIHLTIGVQALKKETLKITQRIHKRHILEQNLYLLNQLKANYTLQFIIGLPGDTYKDIKNDINWAYSFHPQYIHLQTLRINPGTLFEREAHKFGITYEKKPPYVINKTYSMTAKDLKKSEELNIMFKLFYETGFLKKTINQLHLNLSLPISNIIEELILAGIKPVTLFMFDKKSLIFLIRNKIKKILLKNNQKKQWPLFEVLINTDII